VSVSLTVEGDRFAPGDRVRGRVTVLDSGLQVIQVGLLFREESGGIEATASQVLADDFGDALDLDEGATFDFEIELPADAAPTLSTRHGELFWEVVAKTDRVGEPQTAGERFEVVLSRGPGAG
jgi:hypothetical protein